VVARPASCARKAAQGGMTEDSSANVPGANADSDSSVENQGALSAPEKDKM
jgi:hypothetical protein